MLPRWRSTVAPARRRGALPLAGRSHMSALLPPRRLRPAPRRVQLRHGPAFDVTDRYRMAPIRRRAAAARAAGRRSTGGQATPRAAPTALGGYHVRSARRRLAPPPAPRRRGVAPLAGGTGAGGNHTPSTRSRRLGAACVSGCTGAGHHGGRREQLPGAASPEGCRAQRQANCGAGRPDKPSSPQPHCRPIATPPTPTRRWRRGRQWPAAVGPP
jgi:hypothetical protein